jgi:hypothetical protein
MDVCREQVICKAMLNNWRDKYKRMANSHIKEFNALRYAIQVKKEKIHHIWPLIAGWEKDPYIYGVVFSRGYGKYFVMVRNDLLFYYAYF